MQKDKKIIIGGNVSKSSCGCQPVRSVGGNESRRSVLKMAALGVAAGLAGARSPFAHASADNEEEQSARPRRGDFLVFDKAVSSPKPIRIDDIVVGKPMLAYPFELGSGIVSSASRFNKVLLLRFDKAELPDDVAANAAGGVLAFSAICTHQNCDVDIWMEGAGLLACFCHGSMFRPLDGGSVAAGPAPRALPVLPVTEKGDLIMVADSFSSAPG